MLGQLLQPVVMSFLLILSNISYSTNNIASTAKETAAKIPAIQSEQKSEQKTEQSIIPLSAFFGDPEYAMARISPDGKHLAYLAPHQGVLNVWVAETNQPQKARPITHNKTRGISKYYWAHNNENIIYEDDNQGDENWRLYRTDIKTGKTQSLVSFKKVQVQIAAMSPHFPDEILIGINQRRGDFHDIHRLNLRSGKLSKVFENNQFVDFCIDDHFNLRMGIETTPDGGYALHTLSQNPIKPDGVLLKIAQTDLLSTAPIGFNKTADVLYMVDSRDRNTSALVSLDLKTKAISVIGEDKKSDIAEILIHPTEKTIQGYAHNYERQHWTLLDNKVKNDMDALKKINSGEITIANRSLDDKKWIVAFTRDVGSHLYYIFDRDTQKAQFLFASRPALEKLALNPMDPVVIKSRDNLELVSYLTLPKAVRFDAARAKTPVPLVLLVHGGPNLRDNWEYDPEHQWLSNRGYAVLSVNYRGSTGFGKTFTNAGNGEWGAKMHDDLIDAVDWAIKQGVTTKDKVAIMGGSFGGYATLIGLTKTPDVFACGVDIVGMSNLETMMKSFPDYWKPLLALEKIIVGGDPDTEAGRQFLATRSPLTYVNQIIKPLLIAQGANDPRVKQAESEQIVDKMQKNKIPVTYVLFPDEGHGFKRPENRLAFYAITEAFLAQHLGGGKESKDIKQHFKNSSVEIKAGKQLIKGL